MRNGTNGSHKEFADLIDGVAAGLDSRYGGSVSGRLVRPLAPGYDASVVVASFVGTKVPEVMNGAVVLRALPAARLEHARWEQAVHHHLLKHGLAVPEIFDVVAVGERAVQVMSLLPGRSMATEMTRRPWTVRGCADRLAALLAIVHHVPTDGFPSHPVAALVDRRLAGSALDDDLCLVAMKARHRILDDGGLVVVHGDFHPLNVLVDTVGTLALLDWTDAGLAQPEADLARLETALDLAAVGAQSPLQRRAITLIGKRFPVRVRQSYEARTGRGLREHLLSAWRVIHRVHDLASVSARAPAARVDHLKSRLAELLLQDGGPT